MGGSSNYRIGRGRPPTEHQFRPGASGNPAGRPRGSKNVGSIITQALNEKITITEHGKRRRISKLEAAAKQVANQAAGGDPKAIRLAFELMAQADDSVRAEDARTQTPEQRKAADTALLEMLRDRINLEEETRNV